MTFRVFTTIMGTFTTSLPDELLHALSTRAKSMAMPKNKLIENALRLYLEHLEKAEYIKSFKRAAADKDTLALANEGMAEYLKQLEK